MSLIYWVFPNLVLAVSAVGTEIIDILPGDEPGTCSVQHGWMATTPAPDDATRAGYLELYEAVHAAVRDEDFALLPSCGDGIRHAQHDHMVIGRNEIGVQNVVRAFVTALGPRSGRPRRPRTGCRRMRPVAPLLAARSSDEYEPMPRRPVDRQVIDRAGAAAEVAARAGSGSTALRGSRAGWAPRRRCGR